VTTTKIKDSNVTTAKIASGAITADKFDRAYIPMAGGTMSGTITGADKRGTWISTFTSNTAVYVPANTSTGSAAQGVLSWRTANGD
jgi:hypothetical protein